MICDGLRWFPRVCAMQDHLCFAVEFENGPVQGRIRPEFGPTWSDPAVSGSTCGCKRPVLDRLMAVSGSTCGCKRPVLDRLVAVSGWTCGCKPCKITCVLQCNLKMDPSRAGSDPNSARLGRIRPCLGRLAGANDPFWTDLELQMSLNWMRYDPVSTDLEVKMLLY